MTTSRQRWTSAHSRGVGRRPRLLFASLAVLALATALSLPGSTASASTGNTAEDNFQRADTAHGWGSTTNNDGLPNLAWQRSLSAGSPYSSVLGGNGIISYAGTNGHKIAGYVTVPANAGGDVLEEISFSAIGHQLGGLMLQVSGGAYWYQADINTNANVINLVKRNAGVMNWVASIPFTATANTRYWIRLDVQPSAGHAVVNARVWMDGTPEPSGWQVSYTDPSPLAPGQAGAMGDWPKTPAPGEAIHYLNWSYAATGLATPAS